MLTTSKEFLQQVFSDFSKDECPSMAAALAYATLFSLPSLLLIVIYIAASFWVRRLRAVRSNRS